MRARLFLIFRGSFAAAVAAFVVLLSAGKPSLAARDASQVSQTWQSVRNEMRANGWVRVIVEIKLPARHVPEASLRNITAVLAQRQIIAARRRRLLSQLPAGTYRVAREYLTIPYVALDVTESALSILGVATADIEQVMPDAIVRPELTDSIPLVQADQAWDVGFDGTGTAIAVLDTGVDRTHPFLAGKVVEEACFSSTVEGSSETFCPNRQDEQRGIGSAAPCPLGDCLHGTHVAGIAAGNGGMAGRPFSGVAKGAQLIAVQVFSRITDPTRCGGLAPCVGAFTSDILAGLERAYVLSWERHIAAVNLSLGATPIAASCDDEPYKPIIDSLRARGIATVVSSGNGAATSVMSAPACVSSAVSVGSTSKSDSISWFSNVAPSLSLVAPGESITSSVPGGAYGTFSGTSMAAAHVAGAWAVLKQASPGASVSTVLNALRQTGLPIADTRSAGATTTPRLRLFQALASLVTVANPAPDISALSPAGARAGDAGFSLTVTGSRFNAFSVVLWNGLARPTTVVSSSTLEAAIPSTDLKSV